MTLRLSYLFLALGLVACSEAPVGSKQRPFTMYFIPSVDATKISASADLVTKYVSKAMSQKLYGKDDGFYVTGAVPSSYIAVVEAFGTKKADFAALTVFSYILAKDIKKYDMEAVLMTIRENGEDFYRGEIIARKDSGIKSLKDLQGKKFAFTDPASTSGFVLPTKLLNDNQIKLGETVFGQKHDSVVTMVYQKQVDAGAAYYNSPVSTTVDGKVVETYNDARVRVKTQFPDVLDKIQIVALTDKIPNDPWVLRGALYKDPAENERVKKAFVDSLLEFANTPDGKEMLKILATSSQLIQVSDERYNGIRQVVREANIDIEKALTKPKG